MKLVLVCIDTATGRVTRYTRGEDGKTVQAGQGYIDVWPTDGLAGELTTALGLYRTCGVI